MTDGQEPHVAGDRLPPESARMPRAASTFLRDAERVLRALERVQRPRADLDRVARERFDRGRALYEIELARAAATEAREWRALLDVPGMTVHTAAAMVGVSVATIHRRLKEARDV